MKYQGHYISMEHVAWSPDGCYLAVTSSYTGIVQVWQVARGMLVHEREFAHGYAKVLAWSPDGRYLLLGTVAAGALLWELATNRDVTTFRDFTFNSVWASTHLAWSPDGKWLALAAKTDIHIVNSSSGKTRMIYREHENNIFALAWSPDGLHIVSSCERDEQVHVWNVASGHLVTSYQGHSDEVLTVAWSPDGGLIASGSRDHTVQVWRPFEGKLLRTYEGSPTPVRQVAWSHRDRYLAAAYDYDAVHVWEDLTGKEVKRERAVKQSASSVAWSLDDCHLAEAGYGALITDVWSGEPLARYGDTRHAEIDEATLHPDGSLVATSAYDHIRVWDSSTGEQCFEYHGHDQESYISELAWSPDGMYIASTASLPDYRCPRGQHWGSIHVWHAPGQEAAGQQVCTWEEHSGMIFALRWSPDSRRLATHTNDKHIRIWEALTGRCLLEYRRAHSGSGLCWSPDGALIAAGQGDRVHIWNATTGVDVLVYQWHGLNEQGKGAQNRSISGALAWSPDGRYLASAASGDNLHVWEAASGQTRWIGEWRVDEDEENPFAYNFRATVKEVAWSPDGRYLLACGGDNTVRIWNAASGEQLFVYREHHVIVKSIGWFPDSKRVISTGDGGAHIWQALP